MKKLTLALDKLRVDTFVAGAAEARPGTVRAHDFLEPIPGDNVFAPAPVSWDTQCDRTICLTCDRGCPSAYTACYTGSAPNCCVIV
ncbi:MAG TPA: hypothetical protein VF092_05865 [Longimicrobium sp.]